MLQAKKIAVSGKISALGGKPIMYINTGKDVEILK